MCRFIRFDIVPEGFTVEYGEKPSFKMLVPTNRIKHVHITEDTGHIVCSDRSYPVMVSEAIRVMSLLEKESVSV